MAASTVQRIPLQVARDCVVASIQIDLGAEVLRQFRRDLLECVQANRASGVILDVSGLEVIDLEDYSGLLRTMEMATVMGAIPVLSGLKPGVVSALIDLGAEAEGVNAALTLDDAFRLLDEIRDIPELPEEAMDNGQASGSDPGKR